VRAVAACGSAPAPLRAEYGVLGRPQRARDRVALRRLGALPVSGILPAGIRYLGAAASARRGPRQLLDRQRPVAAGDAVRAGLDDHERNRAAYGGKLHQGHDLRARAMQGIQFTQFGGPEVLELVELPDPEPGPGQIRVAVRATGVNPIDWKVRSGAMGGDLPRRTGQEVAGVVDKLGDGVTGVEVGEPVFGAAAGGGGAAQLALVESYARMPEGLDFADAAALPVAVETAVRTLDVLGVGGGQTIVINGASGSVGISAVQCARARGARVIGTASAANQDYVREFGAEPTTYGDGLVARVRALASDGVDRALDASGGGMLPALVELTGSPERVVTIADYAGAEKTGVPFSGGMGTARAWHALADVAQLIQDGRFRLPVAQKFPLADIAEAHRISESGHPRGKLVLVVSEG
jgi:NADPH:quinone reductase-like Zn-dependent oxidoreductase